jgi:hypothetical protein
MKFEIKLHNSYRGVMLRLDFTYEKLRCKADMNACCSAAGLRTVN